MMENHLPDLAEMLTESVVEKLNIGPSIIQVLGDVLPVVCHMALSQYLYPVTTQMSVANLLYDGPINAPSLTVNNTTKNGSREEIPRR